MLKISGMSIGSQVRIDQQNRAIFAQAANIRDQLNMLKQYPDISPNWITGALEKLDTVQYYLGHINGQFENIIKATADNLTASQKGK